MIVGLDLCAATAPRLSPLDPRTVPALLAGGIWLPGVGYTSTGGANHKWASQATQANDFVDSHDGYKPAPSTASNGAAVYDLPAGGPTASWYMAAPGSALRWQTKGTYAFWAKASSVVAGSIYYLFQHSWPGGPSNNRIYARKSTLVDLLSIDVSWLGSAVDSVTPGVPGGRGKGNYQGIDFTRWNFFRFSYDVTRSNYLFGGGFYSHRLEVYVNELLNVGTGFSAPGPTFGGDPPDGPVRDPGLYPGTDFLTYGASFVSSQWPGQLGPFYVANEDAASQVTDNQWPRIMAYNAPG